jgi:hypothetical protein
MTALYATEVTQAFLNRQAAIDASGSSPNPLPPFNFVGGTLAVGDGNGAVPTLSTLLAQNGLTHQVWSGQTITGVNQDAEAANQIDIQCVIPDVVNGVEVGGFTIREFAIWDEQGNLCVLGITNIEKTTSQQGQINTVMFVAAIVVSNTANVVITPPSANFVTMLDVENAFNANLPTAAAPLFQADTQTPTGWIRRVFGLRPASQPAAGGQDGANTGYGRPATNAEFAAGVSAGGFAWPWPTLQQIKSTLGSIVIPVIPSALAPLFFDAADNRYGVNAATTVALGVGRVATAAEAQAGVTAPGTPTPAFVTPEDFSAANSGPGVGINDFVDGMMTVYGLTNTPADAGLALGNTYAASALQSGSFPGTNGNFYGFTGINGSSTGILAGYGTPAAAVLGTMSGSWMLVSWRFVGSGSGMPTCNFVLRFKRVA